MTQSATFDNAANLNATELTHLEARCGGTRQGRQELMGEMLLDVPGALWTRAMMDAAHVEVGPSVFGRIVVAIDPAGSSNKNSDETGIISRVSIQRALGMVLADLSGKYSPERGHGRLSALKGLGADRIVWDQQRFMPPSCPPWCASPSYRPCSWSPRKTSPRSRPPSNGTASC
jgi:phage terminase large subunit-like protein